MDWRHRGRIGGSIFHPRRIRAWNVALMASRRHDETKEQFRERARQAARAYYRRNHALPVNVIQFYALGRYTTRIKTPPHVSEERHRVFSANLTPDQMLMGDPMPGRSALDKKRAKEAEVFGGFFKCASR